jgi:serine/threonine protein kinase
MSFSIPESEWDLAKEKLENAPNGSKFKDKLHSFIKVNNAIYCMAKVSDRSNDPRLKKGTEGKAKYAISKDATCYVIKITPPRSALDTLKKREQEILFDLNKSMGTDQRVDKKKIYTVLKYTGVILEKYLAENDLSEDKRLDVAAQLAYNLYSLHHGLTSSSNKAYAHMDVKPDNATIDDKGMVHLIDFGMSKENPLEKTDFRGAINYSGYYELDKKLSGAELDVVALKRSLFMPKEFYCADGHVSRSQREYEKLNQLLPKSLLEKYNLSEFIDTSSTLGKPPNYNEEVMDPLVICAVLINAKSKLGLTENELKSNLFICHAIAGAYFSNLSDKLPEVIKNEKLLTAMHLNKSIDAKSYESLIQDKQFCEKINESMDPRAAFSLLKLKELGLENFYDGVLNSPKISQVIEYMAQQGKSNLIAPLLINHREDLVDGLLDDQDLINLMQNLKITDAQRLALIEDKTKYSAIKFLYGSDTFLSKEEPQKMPILHEVLNDKEISLALVNFHSLNLNGENYLLRHMLVNKEKCSNFNILFNAMAAENSIPTYREIEEIFTNEGDLKESLELLNKRGWNSSIPAFVRASFIEQLQLGVLLKNDRENELPQQIVQDKTMTAFLANQVGNQERFSCLKTLYANNLLTDENQKLLNNPDLIDLIIKINKELPAAINNQTMEKTNTIEAFLLAAVREHPQVIQLADKHFKTNAKFMLDCVDTNVESLAFVDKSLISVPFITAAVRINSRALQHLPPGLKLDFATKIQIKRAVLHYEHANPNDSRFHLFTVTSPKQEAENAKIAEKRFTMYKEFYKSLKEAKDQDKTDDEINTLIKDFETSQEYKNIANAPFKRGDSLKTEILQNFKKSIEGIDSVDIDEIATKFKKSDEYKILCKAQGLTSTIFNLETTSAKAVDKIIEDAHRISKQRSFKKPGM